MPKLPAKMQVFCAFAIVLINQNGYYDYVVVLCVFSKRKCHPSLAHKRDDKVDPESGVIRVGGYSSSLR